MIGSTIVYIPVLPDDLSNLCERILEDEEFEFISLERLTSSHFYITDEALNSNWDGHQNIIQDMESGYDISRFTREGLDFIFEFEGELEDIDKEVQIEDIAKLKEFANKHGFDNLYELSTF